MFYTEKNAWIREHNGELLRIETCGPTAFRVRATRLDRFPDKPGAIDQMPDVALTVEQEENTELVEVDPVAVEAEERLLLLPK